MRKRNMFLIVILMVLCAAFISHNVFAGKLYIKPDLELKRARRIISEAEAEFRHGKIHLQLSPEIAIEEFTLSKSKYEEAMKIIEDYGAGYYTPGDLKDFEGRTEECDNWTEKCKDALEKNRFR